MKRSNRSNRLFTLVPILCMLTTQTGVRAQTDLPIQWMEGGNGGSVAYSPDGRLVAQFHDYGYGWRGIYLTDLSNNQLVGVLDDSLWNLIGATFSPDGKYLAAITTLGSPAYDGVQLWDTTSLKLIRAFGSSGSTYMCGTFSRDGRTFAVGGHGGVVEVWDVATGKRLTVLHVGAANGNPEITSLSFSFDDKLLAIGGLDGVLMVFDTTSGSLRPLMNSPSAVLALAFSPTNYVLAVIGYDDATDAASLQLLAGSSGARFHSMVLGTANSITGTVAFAPGGASVVTAIGGYLVTNGNYVTRVDLWDVATASRLGHYSPANGIEITDTLAFAPDGLTLVAGSDTALTVLSVPTFKPVSTLGSMSPVAISSDGNRLFAGDGPSGTVDVLDVSTGTTKQRIFRGPALASGWGAIACSLTGSVVAAAPYGTGIGVASGSNFGSIKTLAMSGLSAGNTLSFSPDGRALAAVGCHWAPQVGFGGGIYYISQMMLKLWSIPSGAVLASSIDRYSMNPHAVAFPADGSYVLVGGESEVTGWDPSESGMLLLLDPRTAALITELTSSLTYIYSIAISPDGKTIADGGVGKGVELWSRATSRLSRILAVQGTVRSLSYSPSGACLFVSTDRAVYVYDTVHYGLLRTYLQAVAPIAGFAFGSSDASFAFWRLDGVVGIANNAFAR